MLHPVADLVAWLGWYVVPFIVILSAIVFFHELGHYLVARWCGVRIDAFSLGFGPELFARVDSRGTRWRVAALPLGGYVKFHGDANAASVDSGAVDPSVDRSLTLAAQPLPNRAAIVLAGPVANFILAFVIFTGMFMAFGRVEHMARIGRVEPNSPAAAAGFQAGDLVKSIDGDPIRSFEALQESTLMSTGLPMTFVVERDGRDVSLTATPRVTRGRPGRVRQAPHGPSRPCVFGESEGRHDRAVRTCRPAPSGGPGRNGSSSRRRRPISSASSPAASSTDQVSGLIGAAQMAGEMAKISLWELFSLAAWFSVSVGFMNLLPIPLLDGGHLVFYACEAVLGRPLSERMQEIGLQDRHRPGRASGGVHHLARHPAPRVERQLTISRPSLRVLAATPSGNGVVLPNKGLQERPKTVKRR